MATGCAARLPRWLAPNLITLMGTMGLVASYLVSGYYAPDFVGACVCVTLSQRQQRQQLKQESQNTMLWAGFDQQQREVHTWPHAPSLPNLLWHLLAYVVFCCR